MATTNQIGSSYPIVTADISAAAVTYGKMQNTSAGNILLGNPTGSAGAVREITLGTNLSFSGTTLNATGGAGGSFNYGLAYAMNRGIY